MPRSKLTITGLDFGKHDKNLAYYYGLSDFWSAIFEDSDKIELLLEATSQKLSDIYSHFLQLTSSISIADIGTATSQQLKLVLIDESQATAGLNTYKLSTPILKSRLIVNKPFLPTAYYEEEIHYRLAADGTTIQFFSSLSLLGFPSRTLSTGAKQYALWFVDTVIDEQALYNFYGKMIDISPQASTDAYKNFIYGLYYLYTNGPDLALLRKGLNLALGIPLARETEVVLETRKYIDTDQWLVITDLNSYLIPFGLAPTVKVGDIVHATDELARWIEVKDWIHDGSWWLNLAIPPAIMPYIPTGQTDRFAKAGSYADYLMVNFLKKHTFLVNVKTIDFKNLQTFAQISSIINAVKPSYTSPIYIWTVPANEEAIPLDEKGLLLRWDQSRCENISVPIGRMRRLNAQFPFIAAKPVSVVASDNIRLSNQSSLYRNTRTSVALAGEAYWEVTVDSLTTSASIGIGTTAAGLYTQLGSDAFAWIYANNGQKRTNNVNSAYGATYTVGDVIGIQYNVSTGTLTFYKNGVSQGAAFTGLVGTVYPMFGSRGADGAFLYTSSLVTGNYASSPDSVAMSVPSNLDLRVMVSVDDLLTPTLDIPFNDLGSGQVNTAPLVGVAAPTFTRATTATTYNSSGILISVGTGIPRSYYDPTTLEYKGYLAEGSRINLYLRSEQFDNAAWVKTSSVSVTANATTAPDGTLTADLLQTDGTVNSFVNQAFATTSALVYAHSIYAKAGTSSTFTFELHAATWSGAAGAGTTFNLSTGTITGGAAGDFMVALPNGWWRCCAFRTAVNTGTSTNALFPDTYPSGAAGKNLYFWGAQVEQGSTVSTYIPTTTATVTRNDDVLTYPAVGSTWITPSTQTFIVKGTMPTTLPNVFAVEGVGTTGITIGTNGVGNAVRNLVRHGLTRTDMSTVVTAGTTFNAALTYDSVLSLSSTNGALDTGASVPTQADWGTSFCVGHRTGPGSFWFAPISRISAYTTRINSLQLLQASAFESRGLIAKWRTTGNQRSYVLSLDTPNALTLSISSDGTTIARFTSDGFTLAPSVKTFFRVTLNTSAVNTVATFYTSVDSGVTWSQVGSAKSRAGTLSLFDSTALVEIGSTADGTASIFTGKTYYSEVANGLNIGETYLLLPGTANNYVNTPDSVANSVTGDIDIRIKAALTDWTPSSRQTFLVKRNTVTDRAYGLSLESNIGLGLSGSVDGASSFSATATVLMPTTDGAITWIRTTRVASTGVVQFFTSPDGVVWTQLGADAASTPGNLFDTSASLDIGWNGANGGPINGKIYYAEVRNGINGTVVVKFDPIQAPLEATSFVSSTGETWTINKAGITPARLITERVISRFEPAQLQYAGATTLASDTGETWTINQSPPRYLFCPGLNGNYAAAPDSAAVSIVGDVDLRAKVLLKNWTPASVQTIIIKGGGTEAFGYGMQVAIGGTIRFGWNTNGTTSFFADSTVIAPFANNSVGWVRATLKVNNGSAGRDITFYTSLDGVMWAQLGAIVTQAGTTSIFDGLNTLKLGANGGTGTFDPLNGNIYYAEVRNGINGTVAAKFDPTTSATVGASSFTSATGEVWTVNTSGVTPAAIVAGVGQADLKINLGNDSALKANFGVFPFAFTVPATSTEGVYTEDVKLTRGCPQFTRDSVSYFTNGQLGEDPQINARASSFEGGIITGFINSVRQLRPNTREEDAVLRTLMTRNMGVQRQMRGKMAFIRNEPIPTIEGVGVRIMPQLDTQRVIHLYNTVQQDLATKYATVAAPLPGLSTWNWTLFQAGRSNIGGIDGRAINSDFADQNSVTIGISAYNTFFIRGPTHYLGNFMPQIGYRTYTPLFSDIRMTDYLLFWRVYENTVGVFWVTTNASLDVPYARVAEKTDPVVLSSFDSPLKYGLAPYSSYYLLRGLGGTVTTTGGNTIDSVAIDAKPITGPSGLTKLYSDDANPVAITVLRNTPVLKFRRDFK